MCHSRRQGDRVGSGPMQLEFLLRKSPCSRAQGARLPLLRTLITYKQHSETPRGRRGATNAASGNKESKCGTLETPSHRPLQAGAIWGRSGMRAGPQAGPAPLLAATHCPNARRFPRLRTRLSRPRHDAGRGRRRYVRALRSATALGPPTAPTGGEYPPKQLTDASTSVAVPGRGHAHPATP